MSAPAGWYPTENGSRYWDGASWQEPTQVAASAHQVAVRGGSPVNLVVFAASIGALIALFNVAVLVAPLVIGVGVFAAVLGFTTANRYVYAWAGWTGAAIGVVVTVLGFTGISGH